MDILLYCINRATDKHSFSALEREDMVAGIQCELYDKSTRGNTVNFRQSVLRL